MSDFVSDFWSYYVAILTLVSVIGCGVFLYVVSIRRGKPGEKVDTTGHIWDEDLQELNNPLPRWWMWLFYITIVFSLIYLVLYPGLGKFGGAFGWSSSGQFNDEIAQAEQQYGPIYNRYLQQDLKAVAASAEAREMGHRLFLTYCSQCHGSDAGGASGFPNLRDQDWLYGGDPDMIKTSIANGRNGVMPPLGAALGGETEVKAVANYVLSLSGARHDAALAAKGKDKFAVCAACHGVEGKGNPAIGAPNLTDNVWLYGTSGSSEKTIIETITLGRTGGMPPWKERLGDAKVHVLAAYVYGLSQGERK